VEITDNMEETAKFEAFKLLKIQALEDPELKALKEKADTTLGDEESRKASITYNRALFRKIRELEPKLNDYTNRVESSLMKTLNADRSGE
jgi:hypothetical protein